MSQKNIFFLTFPIGLENIGESELELKWPLHFKDLEYTIINRVMGGIEIECPIEIGFLLNNILKCPSRILMRLHSFKCRDVPKLFQKTSKFNWSPYLLNTTPKVHIAASESRLFDSRKIEKAFHDGVKEFYRHQPMKKKYQEQSTTNSTNPEIFIRFENDTCTFSLDTTGELLHKRGEKLLIGHAPIRESLASLLLLILEGNQEATLVDPMCGSGTFLLEAHDFYKINKARHFSYMLTPFFQELKTPLVYPLDQEQNLFKFLFGFDNDPTIIAEAIINSGLRKISFSKQDIFESEPLNIYADIAIVNPPYGKRVGNKEDIDIHYYLKILQAIRAKYESKKIGIIIPQEYSLRNTKKIKIVKSIPFKNGGIPVVFYVVELE